MLDSIYIGMSGLNTFAQGLRVIGNNTANMNTPGFKASTMQFADLFTNAGSDGQGGSGTSGHGVGMTGTTLNFRQGELRQTGNALDLAVDGQGLFVLEDDSGKRHYTRAGQFEFDSEGRLVNRADGRKVMGLSAGALEAISIAGVRVSGGKPSSTIAFSGNLSSTEASQTVSGITVFDAVGGEHKLDLVLTNTGDSLAGSWDVALMDGTTKIASQQLVFESGRPTAASAKIHVRYKPDGLADMPLSLDFSNDVSAFAAGNLSTLAMSRQDGYAPAAMTSASIDKTGTLVLSYANGQVIKGARLALGRFDSIDDVGQGGSSFDAVDGNGWHMGVADGDAFGVIKGATLEMSNVDLSQEFSELVVMQRGYQASSQIIATANDMLEELFAMKGK